MEGAALGFPLAAYQAEARKRLKRIQGRPVLVCQNGPNGTQPTRSFLGDQVREGRFTFLDVPVKEIFPTIPTLVLQSAYRPLAASRQSMAAPGLAVDGPDGVARTIVKMNCAAFGVDSAEE